MFSGKSIKRCTLLQRGACKNEKSKRGIQKILSVLKLPSYRLVVFIDMNTYIVTEGDRSFKTFLKENCAVTLDSYYLFTKNILNMELNMILIVLMETLDIPEIYGRFG